jgi:transitional endoplasmic reticulum ATPase
MAHQTTATASGFTDPVAKKYFHNAHGERINTDAFIFQQLQALHPDQEISVVPEASCNILEYAAAGQADVIPDPKNNGTPFGCFAWDVYIPPASRLHGTKGALQKSIKFGKFLVHWRDHDFIIYLVEGRDGHASYPITRTNYILGASPEAKESLFLAVGDYSSQLHGEIWVFNSGMWHKDAALWDSVEKASWDAVILDPDMKASLIDDVHRFFDGRKTYERLGVPWKRGLIFHGPPGNGKTISIKATMHMLYQRKEIVPTLYVRSLSSFAGPEYSLDQIFSKARATAPCYLVFEDLDSLVTPAVRSFFLNQVDGLGANDGILMLGSTNHLELLDPGISKRPSRFDRKYLFPNPNFDERVLYAKFWRAKVLKSDNGKSADTPVEFPERMCKATAEITNGFSFAYIQEAFLAALQAIAVGGDTVMSIEDGFVILDHYGRRSDGLEEVPLWVEFQKQVKILRGELDNTQIELPGLDADVGLTE